MIKVDLSGAAGFFDPAGPDYAAAAQAHRTLLEHTGAGADFTGWLDLPERMQSGELKQILTAASRIRGRSQALVVVGIGGSYLGAKGALELLRPRPQPGDPKILFAGNSLSPDALMHLLEELGDLDFDLNVVSKSGTTLEPALAFRMFRGLLEAKYGPEKAKKHIFATTDAHRGVLKHMADEEGWETFVVPDDVGGRYSVLSAVGLLPMAAAGIDVQTVIGEAGEAFAAMSAQSPENPAWQYATARQHLYQLGKTTEILACYEPSFRPRPAQLPCRAQAQRHQPHGAGSRQGRAHRRRRAESGGARAETRRGRVCLARVLLRAGMCHFGLYVRRQSVRSARRGSI